ncbi:DUF4159 domain-containing protein [Candidatus Poribacteria bacterium]|nr:DUF4159 domain-containing protein [Candidatus Poribacteria bacterium]
MPLRYPRKITFASFLISIILNLLLVLLIALVFRQYGLRSERTIQVDIIHLPRKMPAKHQAVQREPNLSVLPFNETSELIKPQNMTRPRYIQLNTGASFISTSLTDLALPPLTEDIPEDLSARLSPLDLRNRSRRTPTRVQIGRSRPGYRRSKDGRRIGWPEGPRWSKRPQVNVKGTGRDIAGYYDIVTVRYEDTADIIRAGMLSNLVRAMNRWTNVRTRLLPRSIPLDDPAIRHIPILFIAARGAFAFSEKERANLRGYLRDGGTVFFSDISLNWGDRGAVANSIRFELWRILGDISPLRPVGRDDPICFSFFPFKKGPPLVDEKRGRFYALRMNGRIAVVYDAAGIGLRWMEKGKNERWLRWGVNLIVYTLTSKSTGNM